MFLSNASIQRPVAMGCLIIALTLMGLNSWRKMGLEFMPKMDAPFITILTVYPGASPEEIETDIAKRIEDVVVSVDGLKYVNSVSMENVCQTLLEFEMNIDVDIAAMDVREKIDLIRSDFSEGVEDPIIQKFDINAKPIITLALAGDVPIDELYDYADNELKDRLTTIPGVAEVALVGGAEREVHVLIDRRNLQARGLTALDVYQTVQEGVRAVPSGHVQDRGTEYTVKFDADCADISEMGLLEVINEDGQRVRIKDVARIEMATEELRQMSTVDGRPAISIQVIKRSDANAVEVTRRVRQAVGDLGGMLPGGMELVWVTDDGRFTEATVWSAWSNVIAGIGLTAGILFLFLYNLRTLFVVSITMPLTVVIGLFFMYMVDFTLNTATLIAIGMSVGILVANSIVVLEATVKRLDAGCTPKEAASLGVNDVFVAVLASAGTNTVVLFPLAIMPSKIGMFIKPLALTMVIMTLVSLFISFTLTPMLCSLLMKPQDKSRRTLLSRMEARWNRGLSDLVGLYRRTLAFMERNRVAAVVIILVVAVVLVHSVTLLKDIGFDMVAETDQGEVFIKLEFPTRYSIDETWRRLKQVEARLTDLPEIKHKVATVGKVEGTIGQSSEGVYLAQLLLKFSERTERNITLGDLMNDIRSRVSDIPEAIITVNRPSAVGGQSSPIEMEISGPSLNTLDRLALNVHELVKDMSGLIDVDTTVREGKPELRIRPNRAVLSDRNMPATTIGMTLRSNLEGLKAGTYKQDARNYDIVVLFDKQEGKDQVAQFQLPGDPGTPVLLETVASITERTTPIQITRKDKQRVSKLFANLTDNKPLGTAVDEISGIIRDKGNFPPGYDFTFTGTYEMMEEASHDFAEALLISIVLVILSLSAILESFKQSFFILITLPLAVIGVMWSLYFTGLSMDIFVMMGCVMMIGIVVNNAILIMDQFNVHVAGGVPRHKAMITAACDRFRPILMTTIAAVLGMVPLAISRGIGAEIRNGLGVSSVGGILISGILTLLLMPVLYSLFTRRDLHHNHDHETRKAKLAATSTADSD